MKIASLVLVPLLTAAAAGPVLAANESDFAKPAAAAREDVRKTFGFVPGFIKSVPNVALPGAWDEFKSVLMNPSTALPGKTKDLVGLAVAAQIPCAYCTYAHTQFAKLNGASDAEIAEAIMMGALTRHWSTYMNGVQLDELKFRSEVKQIVENVKQPNAKKPLAIDVVDAESALRDVEQRLGFVPEFIAAFPSEGVAGAWKELRDVQMSPNTAIEPKYKDLIGLSVAAQIPCRYCTVAHTEFAKLGGASEREIKEAVAVAAMVRHWSKLRRPEGQVACPEHHVLAGFNR